MPAPLQTSRLNLIVTDLKDEGIVRTRALAKRLDVSAMTIRRDLLMLEKQGKVRRVHGGAVLNGRELEYETRTKQQRAQKQAIGKKAAAMVQPGQTLFLDAGSTAMEVATALAERFGDEVGTLRVVTHAINIATALASHVGIRVHQIGGEVYQNTFSAVGPEAVEQMKELNFDLCFLGASGISHEGGWTNSNQVEIEIKRAAMEQADTTFVVADSSKWGQNAFAHISPLSRVNGWITDGNLDQEVRRRLAGAGLSIIIA